MTEEAMDPFAVMRLIDDRRSLLDQIERERMDKPTLVTRVACSRSTVDRAIDQLLGHHLIERTDDGYVLTFPGRRLLEIYDQYYAEAGRITARSKLLATLPADCGLPDELLWNGTIIEGDSVDPGKPQRTLRRLIEDADRLTLSYPVFESYPIDSLVDRLVTDRPTELLLDPPCFEFLFETATESCELLCDHDVLALSVAPLRCGIAYSESEIAVILCDSQRQCCGLFRSTTGRSWAKELYRQQRMGAQRVDDSDRTTRSVLKPTARSSTHQDSRRKS